MKCSSQFFMPIIRDMDPWGLLNAACAPCGAERKSAASPYMPFTSTTSVSCANLVTYAISVHKLNQILRSGPFYMLVT